VLRESYSRSSCRPKSIDFRNAESMLATDLKSSTASRNYERAVFVREELKRLQIAENQRAIEEENNRQKEEQSLLDKGALLKRKMLKKDWDAHVASVDLMCETKLRHMKESHEREMAALLKKQKNEKWTPKFSPELLFMLDYERKLQKADGLEDLPGMRLSVNEKKGKELVILEKRRDQSQETQRASLQARHAREWLSFEQAMKNEQVKARRKRDHSLRTFDQSKKNAEQDMRHAHAMEFCSKKETEVSLRHSRRHFSETSATFRGSQVFSTVQGKKTDPVRLCDMYHFPDSDPES
jgi:hypothetical protein